MIDTSAFQGKKAAYYTLGCKLNFSETSTFGKMLQEMGVRTAQKGEQADLCLINTCSVTEVADHKCRQIIHRMVRQHPGAFVVVTGCYAQLEADEVARIEGVDLVLGSDEKANLIQFLSEAWVSKDEKLEAEGERNTQETGTPYYIKNSDRSLASEIQEEKSDEHQYQVKCLTAKIFLMKHKSSKEETHQYTGPPYHAHNGNHSFWLTQSIEIREIGSGKKKTHSHNGPSPTEGCRLMMCRPPENNQHQKHHATLINIVP